MKIRVGWGEWVVLDGHNLPPSPVVGIGLTKKREEGNCPPAPSLLFTTLQAMHCNRKTSFLLLMDNLHFHTLVFSRDIFWNIHTVILSMWDWNASSEKISNHALREPFAHSVFYTTIHINICVWNVIVDWKYVGFYYLFELIWFNFILINFS